MEGIVNRVKDSGIITIDLADFKPNLDIVAIDIAELLYEGIVLREKDFRSWIKTNDWRQYAGKAVHVHCSADAIIPTWAYMLIASQLTALGIPFLVGEREALERHLIANRISHLALEPYAEGRIIIKGCSDISDPAYAMSELIKRLQPVAKSIMYGEPCSSVPVFKRK